MFHKDFREYQRIVQDSDWFFATESRDYVVDEILCLFSFLFWFFLVKKSINLGQFSSRILDFKKIGLDWLEFMTLNFKFKMEAKVKFEMHGFFLVKNIQKALEIDFQNKILDSCEMKDIFKYLLLILRSWIFDLIAKISKILGWKYLHYVIPWYFVCILCVFLCVFCVYFACILSLFVCVL